jgi:hypothetical protein
MHIGVDFDNTIVCYDALFHRVASERGLIPADLPVNKSDVRNHLRRVGKEDAWTEMQGAVYGGRMAEAAPYPGVIDFFLACKRAGVRVSIISHKTQRPFIGEPYDLHAAALNWLELNGFFDPNKIGLARENVWFELTKQAKLERIGQSGCSHFIDDLPEFLGEAAFPKTAQRWLFDPNDLYGQETRFLRALSWSHLTEILLRFGASPLREMIPADAQILPLSGGGNNRVYKASWANGEAVLKSYFQNPSDTRDRFGAEHAFYTHVWSQGVRRTPEPIGWDEQNRFGLLSFVRGAKLSTIDQAAVRQAAEFIVEINTNNAQAKAPSASEACFSILEHLDTVDKRVARLATIEGHLPIDHQARDFVRTKLAPAWDQAREVIARTSGRTFRTPLPQERRCISPSDFGFHNAISSEDGQLRFFDFEYAGWDDPAKLICDFFCQPQIPVPLELWDFFIEALRPAFGKDPDFATRARLLLPAYQVKWCCIILNEFLRGDRARREFAQGSENIAARKAEQLQKAEAALSKAAMANEADNPNSNAV